MIVLYGVVCWLVSGWFWPLKRLGDENRSLAHQLDFHRCSPPVRRGSVLGLCEDLLHLPSCPIPFRRGANSTRARKEIGTAYSESSLQGCRGRLHKAQHRGAGLLLLCTQMDCSKLARRIFKQIGEKHAKV
ncbi:hypothetical protein KCP78_24460 [Salmonella enterica subsp. enterica]|nr:hypothetical protein KCP78_24460 [Salmonella enterica subsp. enterica]